MRQYTGARCSCRCAIFLGSPEKLHHTSPSYIYSTTIFFLHAPFFRANPGVAYLFFFPRAFLLQKFGQWRPFFFWPVPSYPRSKSRRLGFARTTIRHCYLQRAGLVRPSVIPSKPKPRLTISCTIARFWSRRY